MGAQQKVLEKQYQPLRELMKFKVYLKDYKQKLWIIVSGSIIFALIRLVDPYIYKNITDQVFVQLYLKNINLNTALGITIKSCLIIFFIRVSTSLIFSFYTYLSMEVSNKMEAKMFRDALDHLQSLDMGFHNNRNSGEILSRVDRGINGITRVLHEHFAKYFLPGIINITFLLGWILYLDWRLAVAGTFFLPFHLYFSLRKASPIYTEQIKINRLYEKIYHRAYEAVYNIHAVISFNKSKYELSLFDKDRDESLKRQLVIARWWRELGFSASFFEVLGRIAVLIFGTIFVYQGSVTTGQIIMFLAYINMLYQPLLDMITMYLTMQQELSKANRLTKLLEIVSEVTDHKNAINIGPVKLGIVIKNLSFKYRGVEKIKGLESRDDNESEIPDKEEKKLNGTLKDISILIPAGKKVAIIGPTGSGKSTLASIIQRHYDPDSGNIIIDGIDLRQIKLDSLRQQITNVPQHALLFSRTIRENIAYGKDNPTEEEIIQAAIVANAHEFILNKPKGYDTQIGEKGVKLSGGEQQRLSIARAVLRNSSVIIMDEATSHLDTHSEAVVQSALWKLMAGKTAIIIAHRLSTILTADFIVVMEKGRILDVGTSEELLSRCSLYRKLYELQFKAVRHSMWT